MSGWSWGEEPRRRPGRRARASLQEGDFAWFASEAGLTEEPARRPHRVVRILGVALAGLLAAVYFVAGFTLAGSLVGLRAPSYSLMALGASATILIPLLLWWWLRRRFYHPRLTLIVLLVNTLFVVAMVAAAPRVTGRAIEARGDWWLGRIAVIFHAEESSVMRWTDRSITWLASILQGDGAAHTSQGRPVLSPATLPASAPASAPAATPSSRPSVL